MKIVDQFEISVRNEAALISEFYEVNYCLEVSIRSVVAEALEKDFKEAVESEPNKNEKNSWWEGVRIGDEIRKTVCVRQQKESTAGVSPRSNDPLDYTTFGELSEIITGNFDVFQSVLSNKKAVIRLMQDLALVRTQ